MSHRGVTVRGMDEQRTQQTPPAEPAGGGTDGPQVVRIRTDQPGSVPLIEDRATRRLGRLPQHAQGGYDLGGPEPARAQGRLLPLLLAILGLAALVLGVLVVAGIL